MSLVVSTPQAGKDSNQLHDALIGAGLSPDLVQSDGTTITLTFPDGTIEADVDLVIAGHVPMARYDPATQLARVSRVREIARLKADYDQILAMGDAIVDVAGARACLHFFIETLIRRDRAAGLY